MTIKKCRWAIIVGAALVAMPALGQSGPKHPDKDADQTGSGVTPESGGTPKEAPSDDAVKEAAQRFQRGLDLYRDGDHALALIEFERAHELVSNYRVLYNIGQVSIQLSRYAHARNALEQYLEQGGDEIPAQRKAEVKADLEMLMRRTAFIAISTNETGAEILVDDVSVGEAPLKAPLLVDAGEHKLSVRKVGYRSQPTQITLAGGDTSNVSLKLTKEEASPTVVVERRVESQIVEEKGSTRRTLLIAGWSGTGLLAAGAALTGVLGAAAASDLHDALGNATTRQSLDDKQSKARTLLAVADGLTVGALILGGITLYATLHTPSRTVRDTPAPSPTALHKRRASWASVGPREALVSPFALKLGPGSVALVGTF